MAGKGHTVHFARDDVTSRGVWSHMAAHMSDQVWQTQSVSAWWHVAGTAGGQTLKTRTARTVPNQ